VLSEDHYTFFAIDPDDKETTTRHVIQFNVNATSATRQNGTKISAGPKFEIRILKEHGHQVAAIRDLSRGETYVGVNAVHQNHYRALTDGDSIRLQSMTGKHNYTNIFSHK
jgi:hypothetical protein